MSELPSPNELRTQVFNFLQEWGKDFQEDDGIKLKIVPDENPIEFSAIYDAINLVNSCSLSYETEDDDGTTYVYITLQFPSSSQAGHLLNASKAYTTLEEPLSQIAKALVESFWEVLPAFCVPVLVEPKPEHGLHTSADSQTFQGEQDTTWEYFRFRSASEVRIAQALDEIQGVLFIPNGKARLGHPKGRENREPDFLVCYRGKWGILEVDGPTHRRAATDHARDRLFKLHGIHLVEHYDATECYENPQRVVKQFLYLLSQAK
jgi:hypothetical protein